MFVRQQKINFKQVAIFLFLPVLGLINSFRFREEKWAKNIFWLFCIYYGYTFIISNEGVDAFRYSEWFISLRSLDFTLANFISTLYTKETNYIDILQPLISFILSRFTSNPHWLFATFALIFGFFYSRNIWYFFKQVKITSSFTIVVFSIAFILLIPIWQINGFRFWTAAQIYLFGTLPYLVEKEKKRIFMAALSVFVHFSFIAPVLILFIYVFAGNRKNIYFILFIMTLFINELNLSLFKQQIAILPEIFQRKSDVYLINNAISQQQAGLSSTNWYIKYYDAILKWIIYSFLILFFFRKMRFSKIDFPSENIFSFSLLLFAFINIVNLMPQGLRFNAVGNMLGLFLMSYSAFSVGDHNIDKILKVIYVPFILVIIIVSVRRGLDYTGINTILGNPFLTPFINSDIPLIQLIK
jgi:hypothetical protein